MIRRPKLKAVVLSVALIHLVLPLARAQEPPPPAPEATPAPEAAPAPTPTPTPPPPPAKAWSDNAEFSYVLTAGNSETTSLGLKNSLKRKGNKSETEFRVGAVRAESTTTTHTVVGPPPVIEEDSTTSLTAENYYVDGHYDYKIRPNFFWTVGAGWDRNTFAGIQNRYAARAGLGNIWKDEDRVKFRTDYALTATRQVNVVEQPDFDETFAGLRLSSNFLHKIGANSAYGNDFIVDENLNDTSDVRGDMTNWLAVAMSARLALKMSLQWLYDHEPAFTTADDPNNLLPPEQRLVQLETLDTIFTSSLVVKW